MLRNTAHPNTSPAPAKRTDNQGRDLAAEQLKRHEQAVTADLVSSAPGTYYSYLHTGKQVAIAAERKVSVWQTDGHSTTKLQY